MKTRLIQTTLLIGSAVYSATAAPVTYSFNFTGQNAPEDLQRFSFQYVSPSYITGSAGVFLSAGQLSNAVLSGPSSPGPYTLFSVQLSQNTIPAQLSSPSYTVVDIQATFLETFDFNQPVTSDFFLSNGPGAPSVYLDRDNTHTQSFNFINYAGPGQVTFSVASAPEPSTFSFLLLAAPAAWLYRRRKRT